MEVLKGWEAGETWGKLHNNAKYFDLEKELKEGSQ